MRAKIDVFRSFFTVEMLKLYRDGNDFLTDARGRCTPCGRVPAAGGVGKDGGTATAKDEIIFANHTKFSIFANYAAMRTRSQKAAY